DRAAGGTTVCADTKAWTPTRSRKKARRMEPSGGGGNPRADYRPRSKWPTDSDRSVALGGRVRAALLDSIPDVGEDIRQPRSITTRRHLTWRRGLLVSRHQHELRGCALGLLARTVPRAQ